MNEPIMLTDVVEIRRPKNLSCTSPVPMRMAFVRRTNMLRTRQDGLPGMNTGVENSLAPAVNLFVHRVLSDQACASVRRCL